MSIMITMRFRIVIPVLASCLLVSPMAQGQSAAGAVTPETAPPDAGAQASSALDETRDEKLDRLFAALSSAAADDQDRIALEIKGLWANSGSPSMDLLLDRALEATADEAHERARVHINALTRLAPDFAEAWNASATLYFIESDYGRAVDHIRRTLVLEPRHFTALSGLAIILERVDRPGPALDAWMRVRALYPEYQGVSEAIERLEPVVRGKEL